MAPMHEAPKEVALQVARSDLHLDKLLLPLSQSDAHWPPLNTIQVIHCASTPAPFEEHTTPAWTEAKEGLSV